MVKVYAKVFFWFDTLGLAAFSVDGVYAGLSVGQHKSVFLLTFLGVMTGVGGGVLRRNIYACASIAGALVMALCLEGGVERNTAILAGFFTVILIRCMAHRFKWNLPKVTSGRR